MKNSEISNRYHEKIELMRNEFSNSQSGYNDIEVELSNVGAFVCSFCGKRFTRSDSRKRPQIIYKQKFRVLSGINSVDPENLCPLAKKQCKSEENHVNSVSRSIILMKLRGLDIFVNIYSQPFAGKVKNNFGNRAEEITRCNRDSFRDQEPRRTGINAQTA